MVRAAAAAVAAVPSAMLLAAMAASARTEPNKALPKKGWGC